MRMKNPPHPGQSVRYDCLEPLGLTVTEGAEILGVRRQTLNNLVNGKTGISPEMAIRLDKAFGRFGKHEKFKDCDLGVSTIFNKLGHNTLQKNERRQVQCLFV
jgi:addiction module HigA family antidote